MKSIFLMIAVMAGYFLQAQSSGESTGRVGYADMGYIMSQLPEVKEMQAEMKSTQAALRTQIQEKSKAVETQYADFNAKAKSMPDTVRARHQRELEEAMGELEQMQQDAQNTLENKQKLYLAPVYLKVSRAIQEVAKENGFAVVLTNKVGNYNFLLYQDPQTNVSDLVLKKFGVTP